MTYLIKDILSLINLTRFHNYNILKITFDTPKKLKIGYKNKIYMIL